MAEIRPFNGLRFATAFGPLSTLIAPPYDVLSPSQRDEHAARNPHNIVHLTLPEGHPDDRSKFVKYTRSAALLSEWRREGAFIPDPAPSFYRYTQWFGDENTSRTSVIVLLRVEPFSTGKVLPHEHTFPKHKEDRLRLLEATRTHLESIFGLYEDPDGAILKAVEDAPAGPVEEADVDGLKHQIEPISDPEALSALTKAFEENRIWIADGHHRYETALAFREALGARPGPVAEDYILIALSSMSDPGLWLLPTHRVVPSLAGKTADELADLLNPAFDSQKLPSSELVQALEAAGTTHKRVFAVAAGEEGLLLTPKPGESLIDRIPGESSLRLKELDATILHRVIFEQLIGLSATEAVEYTRDSVEAIRLSNQGGGVAFLMLPPSVQDMKEIALSGERMPQKSTYYYPKIFSGLVAWSLSDFAP